MFARLLSSVSAAREKPQCESSSSPAAEPQQPGVVAADDSSAGGRHHAPDELLILDDLPPSQKKFMELFDKQQSCFWSAGELNFTDDVPHMQHLSPKARDLFEHILAFFATADSEVLENAVVNFMTKAACLPIRMAYSAQVNFEAIHIKTYFSALATYIPDAAARHKLNMAFKTDPLIRERDEWMNSYIGGEEVGPSDDGTTAKDLAMAKRLVAFACAEGLFFMSAFIVIAWLRSCGLFPVFARANELIARDEFIHVQLGIANFHYLFDGRKEEIGLTDEDILNIVKEAVALECKFATALVPSDDDPERLEGLRSHHMVKHIQNLGNKNLVMLGLPEHWQLDMSDMPPWYQWISLPSKNNFYEANVTNYTTPVAHSADPNRDEEF